MDMTIASFDSISEVNMVSNTRKINLVESWNLIPVCAIPDYYYFLLLCNHILQYLYQCHS